MLLAAGAGTRVAADRNKALLPLGDAAVLAHSVRTVLRLDGVHRVVLVVAPGEADEVRAAVAPHLGSHDLWLVEGGRTRHGSEWRALQVLAGEIDAEELDVVAVHDGARPLAPAALWRRVVDAAVEHGGALPVVPVAGVLGRDGRPRPGLVAVQTPQAFGAGPLLAAYRAAERDGFAGTDTASCLERYPASGVRVVGVPSTAQNLKITFPEDVALAARLLSERP